MKLSAASCLALSTILVQLHAPVHAQTGSVLREQRLADPEAGTIQTGFGTTVASLGDLDGDGNADLAAGAPTDLDPSGQNTGCVWILFLDGHGGVRSFVRIGRGSGGFTGTLRPGCMFGARMAAIGDLDGDGRPELAVAANDPGRLFILFLDPDGTVRAQNALTVTDPAFGGQFAADLFYGNPSSLHDLDGNGTPELMLGDAEASDGNRDTGALWIVRMNPDGSARTATRIGSGVGGFTAVLEERAEFGDGVAAVGDVNGDGNVDLAVTDRSLWPINGRLWVLFLDASARVIGHHATPSAEIDMSWNQNGSTVVSPLGYGIDAVGDLDGDGISEIAFHADQYRHAGGVVLAFLGRDGHLRKRLAIGNGVGGLEADSSRGAFGSALRYLGDLDGDGLPELAVGAPSFSRRTESTVSLLSLSPGPIRNGTGVNALALSERAEPVLTHAWKLELDCAGHAPGPGFLLGSRNPLAGSLLPAGELLVDPDAPLFRLARAHGGGTAPFVVPVPNDLALVNLVVQVQGACGGAPGLALSNALAAVVGH